MVGDKIRNVTGVMNPNAQVQPQVNYILISSWRGSSFQSSPLVLRTGFPAAWPLLTMSIYLAFTIYMTSFDSLVN